MTKIETKPLDAGMRYLNEGDKIEFTLEDGPKGPSAVNLKKLD